MSLLLTFDALILTAANETQAGAYRAQLAARAATGLLSGCAEWMVIADPGGRRVGSGCSTLTVLAELATLWRNPSSASASGARRGGVPSFTERFAGRRVLIVHSGGDARRLPAYAAQGKIFL